MKVGVIGYGNMGSAIVDGWLSNKVCKPSDLLIFERSEEKIKKLNEDGVQTSIDDYSLLKNLDVLLLAIKPQDLENVLNDIKENINKKTIIISVIAGVQIEKYENILGDVKIVRTMPNTPTQIGMGTVGWTINEFMTEKDKKNIEIFIQSMGHDVYLSDESKINAVAAISGSGPAYIFYFMEAMFEAGCEIGLTPQEATDLTLSTFVGSSMMVHELGESPAELRAKVTSKKGSTEAAINVFDKYELKKIILEAAQANCKRGEELNKLSF